MPSSSEEMREQMRRWFGTIDPSPVEDFLRSRGYVPAHTVTREERACVQFLFDEWDYDLTDSYVEDYR